MSTEHQQYSPENQLEVIRKSTIVGRSKRSLSPNQLARLGCHRFYRPDSTVRTRDAKDDLNALSIRRFRISLGHPT
jgi:hypothetical protein